MCFFKKKSAFKQAVEERPDKPSEADELRMALFSPDMVPIAPPKDIGAMRPEVSPEEFTVYRKN